MLASQDPSPIANLDTRRINRGRVKDPVSNALLQSGLWLSLVNLVTLIIAVVTSGKKNYRIRVAEKNTFH